MLQMNTDKIVLKISFISVICVLKDGTRMLRMSTDKKKICVQTLSSVFQSGALGLVRN
jgi:hypothetical protein